MWMHKIAVEYMKQKLRELKEKVDKFIIRVGDFNESLSRTDRTTIPKKSTNRKLEITKQHHQPTRPASCLHTHLLRCHGKRNGPNPGPCSKLQQIANYQNRTEKWNQCRNPPQKGNTEFSKPLGTNTSTPKKCRLTFPQKPVHERLLQPCS